MAIPRPLNDIDAFRGALALGHPRRRVRHDLAVPIEKSAVEIEAMREATQAVVNAYHDLGRRFELGMTERDVSQMSVLESWSRSDDCRSAVPGDIVPAGGHAGYRRRFHRARQSRRRPSGARTHGNPQGLLRQLLPSAERRRDGAGYQRKAELVDAAQEAAITPSGPGCGSVKSSTSSTTY